MSEPLEDEIRDVLRKAAIGIGIDPAEFSASPHDPNQLIIAARRLGLGEAAVLGLNEYLPEPLHMPEIQRIMLPFHDWSVNAWLVHGPGGALLFDTGCSPHDLQSSFAKLSLNPPNACLITHGHHDHIGGIPWLRENGVQILGTDQLASGTRLELAGLSIETVDLSGHYSPALGYRIHGLPRPVFVVGDALFAGSIGKCSGPTTFQLAMNTLSQALDLCPGQCVLLPGHGPATSLAEERIHNPFLTGRYF